MSPLTRLTNIQLSLIHVNPLSDVPILDTLMSFAYVRRHASFPLASHLAVSSNAVRVGYTVVRFNRVRIELTFYHYSLKRTHNLGLESGLKNRWQYICLDFSVLFVPGIQPMTAKEFLSWREGNMNFVFAREWNRYPDEIYPATFLDADVEVPYRSRWKLAGNVVHFRVGER